MTERVLYKHYILVLLMLMILKHSYNDENGINRELDRYSNIDMYPETTAVLLKDPNGVLK